MSWRLPQTRADQFLFFCLVFVAGIALASFLPAALAAAEGGWAVAALAAGLAAAWCRHRPRWLLLGLALVCLAGWRYSLSFPAASAEALRRLNGQRATFVGVVAAEPVVSQAEQRLVLEAERTEAPLAGPASGRVLATVPASPAYSYGQRLKVSCKLAAPAPVQDFAYDRYLYKEGIYSLCYQPDLVSLGPAATGPKQRLLEAKAGFRRLVEANLPASQANLVNGMVLGDQRAMDQELKDYFGRSGLSHVVAISGMNMTLLSILLLELLLVLALPRRPALAGAIALVWLYTLMVGAPASAVRAAVLSSLFLFATLCGRQGDLPRGLALAAALMLWANPRLLRDDLGFALSFLAFLGIAYFQPLYERLFGSFARSWPAARESLALTLSAQTLVWPLLLKSFGYLAWLAPLANFLALPALAPIMVLSLAAWLLSALPALAGGLLLLAGLLAQYVNAVAVLLGRWSGAALVLPGLSFGLLALYYGWLWRWWRTAQDIGRGDGQGL